MCQEVVEDLDYAASLSEVPRDKLLLRSVCCTILEMLYHAYAGKPSTPPLVRVEKVTRADGGEVFRVVTSLEVPVGKLMLIPLVKGPESIVETSGNPFKVPISLGKATGFLLPANNYSKPFIVPFWSVKRTPKSQDANCSMTYVASDLIGSGCLLGQRLSKSLVMEVPGACFRDQGIASSVR